MATILFQLKSVYAIVQMSLVFFVGGTCDKIYLYEMKYIMK